MTVFERHLLFSLCSVLLLIAERQSVTLGQIKRVEDALTDEPGEP